MRFWNAQVPPCLFVVRSPLCDDFHHWRRGQQRRGRGEGGGGGGARVGVEYGEWVRGREWMEWEMERGG